MQPTLCSLHVAKVFFAYQYTSEFSLVSVLSVFCGFTSLILLAMVKVRFKYLIQNFITTLILILNICLPGLCILNTLKE